MIKLRKTILIIFLVFCTLFLSACDYSYYLYHNTDGNEIFLEKEVIGIELIKYENLAAENDPLEEYELDLNRLEVVENLNADNIESFLNELTKIGGISGKSKQVLNSPNGMGIRIVYDDFSFTLITTTIINGKDCIFLGEYDENEEIGITFGIAWQEMIDDFKTLINKYFIIDID